tara:strand:- start:157 stop:342 length:186 start_codon:yes stop_codon:yes gene_type:complete
LIINRLSEVFYSAQEGRDASIELVEINLTIIVFVEAIEHKLQVLGCGVHVVILKELADIFE